MSKLEAFSYKLCQLCMINLRTGEVNHLMDYNLKRFTISLISVKGRKKYFWNKRNTWVWNLTDSDDQIFHDQRRFLSN